MICELKAQPLLVQLRNGDITKNAPRGTLRGETKKAASETIGKAAAHNSSRLTQTRG